VLEQQGGEHFFGEPALDLRDMLRRDSNNLGYINILAADRLMQSPRIYSTFLLWLLSELFERLPEVGDLEKPKIAFFFDEAHLLFDDTPKALLEKIELVVRLIRSKGVGVYFITQNPTDVPDQVLGQLGNRVQHALRAFTPKDQKAVRSAAETFRPNPKFSVASVITELGVGEALVSTLDVKGAPSVVDRVLVCPPQSQIGPITPEARKEVIGRSLVAGYYERAVDRVSAYETLKQRAEQAALAAESARAAQTAQAAQNPGYPVATGGRGTATPRVARSRTTSTVNAMMTSAARAIGSSVGRQIIRGVLGSIFGGKK
jgi:DNA helicase HerA-like ATPase